LDIFETIHNALSGEIEKINSILLETIKVPEYLVNDITSYVLKRRGKKIRPIITLLTSKMLSGNINDASIYLSCAVELVHIATLIHDDVIDCSSIRNGKMSPNEIWNNKTSILAGDFLFSQAFKFMVKAKNLEALELLASASAIIAEGEITQLRLQNEKRIITINEYFDVIEKKTAKLFSSASACGAISCDINHNTIKKIEEFGFLFGKIFQISDDILDYNGLSKELGKDIGLDFFEAKVTLPLIILYSKCDEDEKKFLETRFFQNDKTQNDLKYVIDLLHKYSIHDEIYHIMNKIKCDAINCISTLYNNNTYKDLLIELIDHLIHRKR
jgi:octaprenyl-diphosphate synthase